MFYSFLRNTNTKIFLIVVLLFTLTYLSSCYKLGYENLNVDQFLWYTRAQRFFSAISEGRLKDTYQQYHPGVLLMYLIGLGQFSYKLFTGDSSIYPNIAYKNFGVYNFYTKFYIVTLSIILIIMAGVMIKKLTSSLIFSLSFLILLSLEPFFTGIIRNLHMDGLVSVLIFDTTISFYVALSYKSRKYLLLSGILMGLGLLTKSTTIFAIIYCLIILLGYSIARRKEIKMLLWSGIIWLLTGSLVFYLFFPAMWVEPVSVVRKIVVEGVFATGADGGFTHYINNIRTRDPGPAFYWLVLKYRVTPLTQLLVFCYVILLICSVVYFVNRKNLKKYFGTRQVLATISFLCAVIYVLVLMLASKKTDRYFSPIYPFIVLISVQALFSLYELTLNKTVVRLLLVFTVSLGLLYSIVNLVTLCPYGMAYYNHAWGGLNKAKKEIYINQGGIGYFQVANFINNQNLPESTLVGATWDGPLEHLIKFPVTQPQPDKRKYYKIVVLPLQQDEQFKHGRKLAYSFNIQGYEYWRVYCRDFEPIMVSN